MDKVQLLERYYNSFINETSPRDFFVGMADYLAYADSLTELKTFAEDVTVPKNKLLAHLVNAERAILTRLASIKDELRAYVDEHHIENSTINDAFRDYDGWLEGKIVGSPRLPDALHDQLNEIILALCKMPEHKNFTERYIEYSEDKSYIRRHLPVREYDDFRKVVESFEREEKIALWHQLDEVSTLYQTIKTGRAKLMEMVEELNKDHRNPLAWNVLNHRVLVEDWDSVLIDNSKGSYFFKVERVKPMLERIHTYVLTRFVIGKPTEIMSPAVTTFATLQKAAPKLVVKMQGKKQCGYLELHEGGKRHKIAGIATRQYMLVRYLFNPEHSERGAYSPVFHSNENVYEGIKLPKDKTDIRLKDMATKDARMADIIEWSIKEIQKNKAIRGYLIFKKENLRTYLEITLPEGK